MTIEEQAISGPAALVPRRRAGPAAGAGATSRPCAGWPTSPSAASAVTLRRRRRRRRPQRPGRREPAWPTAAGRCSCSRHSPRSAAPSAAPRTSHPGSSTTRSAPSTRWPPPRRRSGRFGLEEHGLRWRHAPAVLGHPLPDGGWALLHRDREVTAAGSTSTTPATARRGWSCARTGTGSATHLDRRRCSRRSRRCAPGSGCSARLPRRRRAGLRPDAAHARRRARPRAGSAATAPRLLLAGNAGHADIPLDAPGSGLMALLMTMLGQTVGFPVPEGGAGELTPGAGPPARAPAAARSGAAAEVDSGRRRGRPRHRRAHRRRRAARRPARGRRRRRRARSSTAGCSTPTTCPAGSPAACGRSSSTPRRSRSTGRSTRPGPVGAARRRTHPGTVHVADSVEQMTEALGQVRRRRRAGAAVPARRAR